MIHHTITTRHALGVGFNAVAGFSPDHHAADVRPNWSTIMVDVVEIETVLSYGSAAEVDAVASRYGLVRGVHPDACDDCRDCIHVGHHHPECQTLVLAHESAY